MSRTKKDQPYWVRENNEGTRTDHDHLSLGKTVYGYKRVLDEHGEPVMETKTRKRTTFEMKPYVKGRTEDGWARWGYEYTALEVEEEYQTYKTERYVRFVYRDYCTAGEKVPKGKHTWRHSNNDMPCTPDLPDSKKFYRWNQHAPKSYRKLRMGSKRREARDILTGYTKEYNSEREFDDSGAPVTASRRSWWD